MILSRWKPGMCLMVVMEKRRKTPFFTMASILICHFHIGLQKEKEKEKTKNLKRVSRLIFISSKFQRHLFSWSCFVFPSRVAAVHNTGVNLEGIHTLCFNSIRRQSNYLKGVVYKIHIWCYSAICMLNTSMILLTGSCQKLFIQHWVLGKKKKSHYVFHTGQVDVLVYGLRKNYCSKF